jgi:carboxypeptidase T
MMRALLVSILLSFSIFAQDTYKLIRISLNQSQNIETLQQLQFDFEGSVHKENTFIEIVVNGNELKKLQDNAYSYEILIEDLSAFYESRLVKRSGEGFGYGSMGGYYTLAEVEAQLDSMSQQYPQLISVKTSIGLSLENRDIWAIKISDNPNVQENEPEVLYTALHHAREPQSMMTILYYMWYLLENYGVDEEVTHLVNNRQIWFVPVVNADGYVYNQTTNANGGGNWRKNRRNNNDGSYGVDLNRNYGFNWGYDNSGSSPDGSDQTYRGTAAFSEPETQVIRNFCNTHNFNNALNYHTYSNLLIMPWGYENFYTPDSSNFLTYAQTMTQFNGYEYGTAGEILYNVNGDANDWMYGEQSTKTKILAMTPEVGSSSDGFWPATSRIIPLAEENLFPNIYFTHVAGGYNCIVSHYFQNDFNGYQDPGETVDLIFEVQNIGLDASEAFDVEFSCNNPEITLLNPIISFAPLSSQVSISNTTSPVSVQISSNLQPGDNITLQYEININGLTASTDSLRFKVGTPALLFADDAEQGLSNFSGQWAITNSSSHSPTNSFTDSPGGVYPNNNTASMTSVPIDLTGTSAAILNYWTKWEIEDNWDFATIEISANNGSTWQYLRAPDMNLSANQGAQPAGIYGYEGSQATWLEQSIDISTFAGNNILLRFNMDTDWSVQRDGWYLDDISVLYYPPADTTSPVIDNVAMQTTPLPNLSYYEVAAIVNDNSGIGDVYLNFEVNSQPQSVLMIQQNDSTFTGQIPGQNAGTLVEYYIEAFDGQGNSTTAPINAPISMYSFMVSSLGAQISISPDSLSFTLPRGLSATQDIVVTNVGNESLIVNLTEMLPLENSPLTRDIQNTYLENTEKVVVLTDSAGDTNDPAIDVVSVEVSRVIGAFGTITTSFDVTFAAPPDTGTFGIISVDLDQELGTGVFPAPFGYNLPVYDLGSEIEIIFDIGNNFIDTLGLGPLAIALSADDSSFVGFAQIQIQGNVASADFVYTTLFGGAAFDESFNLAATFLSFDDLAYPDFAPDFGHGVFGTEDPISWLSALPQNFSLAPAESITIPVQFVSVEQPGNYVANLEFSSNDTINPIENILIDLTILDNLEPDINLPVTVINDTITDIPDTSRFFTIENSGAGELFYFVSDSLPVGQDWLVISGFLGTIESGSQVDISYLYNRNNLIQGNNYSGIINIVSNDPDERFETIQINVHYENPNSIDDNVLIPLTTELHQNYPNPFNPETAIGYQLSANSHVVLKIFNMLGQEINTLVNTQQSAGSYKYTWSGLNSTGIKVASGVYYYQLFTDKGFSETKKLLLLR